MKKHDASFDVLRIIACFLVIVNHTNSELFLSLQPSSTWALSLSYFYLSKIAVPIFIMISGALLLKRDYSFKEIALKVAKTMFLILLFSAYYLVVEMRQSFDLMRIIQRPVVVSLWYLYMLVIMYISIPIIKKIIDHLSNKQQWIYILLWFVFCGVLSVMNRFEIIHLPSFVITVQGWLDFSGYLLLGHQIVKLTLSKKQLIMISIVGLISICSVLAFSILHTLKEIELWGHMYLQLDSPYYFTTMINAFFVFVVVYHSIKRVNFKPLTARSLVFIGSLTYGIYLLHPVYINAINEVRKVWQLGHPIVSMLVYEIVLFGFSAAMSYCLKKALIFRDLL